MSFDAIYTVIISPENIVKFLSIIVSVLVAIGVLIGNQCLSNRRERKKLVCEKIEAFYEASISYTDACDTLITDIQLMKYKRESGYYYNDPLAYAQLVDSIIRMDMLHALYFPRVDFNKEDYCIRKMPLIWAANSGEIARRAVNIDDVYLKSRKHIEDSSLHLRSICLDLINKSMI